MNTRKIPTRRLSRKQVGEALQSVPMQSILMGASNSKDKALTSKQLKFAEALALGDTKAGAYRKAYSSKGSGKTESGEGQRLAMHPAVSHQVEAFKLAIEAQRYATPAALRALVIERLTAAAINPEHKPAQQLRALELLGKVTEVAAFTERREIIKSDSPADAREKLLASLRAAISKSDGGASLLAELARRPALTIDQDTVMRSDDLGPCETGDIAVERNQPSDIDSAASVAPEPSPAGTVVAIHDVAPPPVPTPPMAADPCSSTLTY